VFRDEEVMQTLDRAGSAHDQDERVRLYREVDRLLVAERCSLIPIEYAQTLLLSRPCVQGYDASPLNTFGTSLDRIVVRPERRG
jgi:ABC-type transport system substrate-binding protein